MSKTTVSFYLNGKANKMSEETQQRIQQIIDETGYEPSAAARAMKAKKQRSHWRDLKGCGRSLLCQSLKGNGEQPVRRSIRFLLEAAAIPLKNEREHVERMLKAGAEGFIIQATYRFGMLAGELEKKAQAHYLSGGQAL